MSTPRPDAQAFLAERILKPLGMQNSGFWVPEGKQERIAEAFAKDLKRAPMSS